MTIFLLFSCLRWSLSNERKNLMINSKMSKYMKYARNNTRMRSKMIVLDWKVIENPKSLACCDRIWLLRSTFNILSFLLTFLWYFFRGTHFFVLSVVYFAKFSVIGENYLGSCQLDSNSFCRLVDHYLLLLDQSYQLYSLLYGDSGTS